MRKVKKGQRNNFKKYMQMKQFCENRKYIPLLLFTCNHPMRSKLGPMLISSALRTRINNGMTCDINQCPCKLVMSYLPGRRDEGSVEVEHVAVVTQAVNDHGQVLLQRVVVVYVYHMLAYKV